MLSKYAVTAGLILMSLHGAAKAGPDTPATQLAYAPPAHEVPTIALPDITVFPREAHPYTSSLGPRASSWTTVRAPHFRVWPGYDSDLTLHAYTSAIGPCPEGQNGSGCSPPHGSIIAPSHYERRPFTD